MSLTINHQTNDISATGSGSVTIDGSAVGGDVAGGVTTGSFNVAADYNAIRLYFNGDNMTSGEFKLFGVS